MKTIYIAPHRTFVLDSDGSLIAAADKGPTEVPKTIYLHGNITTPPRQQLRGPWLEFLQALGSAMVATGARAKLWPGERVRLRWHCRHVPRTGLYQLDAWWPCKFDREVTL